MITSVKTFVNFLAVKAQELFLSSDREIRFNLKITKDIAKYVLENYVSDVQRNIRKKHVASIRTAMSAGTFYDASLTNFGVIGTSLELLTILLANCYHRLEAFVASEAEEFSISVVMTPHSALEDFRKMYSCLDKGRKRTPADKAKGLGWMNDIREKGLDLGFPKMSGSKLWYAFCTINDRFVIARQDEDNPNIEVELDNIFRKYVVETLSAYKRICSDYYASLVKFHGADVAKLDKLYNILNEKTVLACFLAILHCSGEKGLSFVKQTINLSTRNFFKDFRGELLTISEKNDKSHGGGYKRQRQQANVIASHWNLFFNGRRQRHTLSEEDLNSPVISLEGTPWDRTV
jgi:hypothetical protein